ncbi:MAG TPA: radical SAM protein [Verrucomicrobiae bacterium]|nr:radical SAM protein [Verrucomicrobiae bacterium]
MKEANGRVVKLSEHPLTGPLVAGAADASRRAGGYLRESLNHRFVYVVVSPRARGLSVGVNMNPDKKCQFNCVYCEVDRSAIGPEQKLDVTQMAGELTKTLEYIRSGRLRELPAFRRVPDELLQLRHVALSGDGEPTLAPEFPEALQAVMHVRALGGFPFFKLVLITNAVALDLPTVRRGIAHLSKQDEVWAKLDGGTQAYLNRINGADVPLAKVLANILALGRERPVVIQSLFPAIGGQEPPLEEVEEYARRLQELRQAGAQISLVQIYSASRPTPRSECTHLPLRVLSGIAQKVRQATGLNVEVF